MNAWGGFFACLGTVLFAGCGGGGGGSDPVDPRLARLDEYDMQRISLFGDALLGVDPMGLTPDANIPAMGRINFAGHAVIRIETQPQVAVLAGDATVVMDFDGAVPVEGVIDNVFGTDPNGVLRDYAGSVALDNGVIGGDDLNAWQADYAGTLSASGQAAIIAGTVAGEFHGNTVSALSGVDFETQIDFNGDAHDGIVTIIAERE